MLTEYRLTALAATISFAYLIDAIPAASLPAGVSASVASVSSNPDPDSVLYAWSSDPACVSTACATDCQSAYASICNSTKLASSDSPHQAFSANATVGDCTAFYWIDAGAKPPTPAQCAASYTQILAAARQPANGCGGTIGGALGYNAKGRRTSQPLYAIYPAEGNANCFKAPGDTAKVLAANVLPNGISTLQTCPDSTSRRRALNRLEGRDQAADEQQADDNVECAIEDGVSGATCTVLCLATVVSTSWITGPFAAAGWLACLGGCSATGIKVFNNCQKAKGNDVRLPYNLLELGDKVRRTESSNPCLNIKDYSYQCPSWQSGLLSQFQCAQPSSGASNGGSSGINM